MRSPALTRILDGVLGPAGRQRVRASQSLLGLLVYASFGSLQLYAARHGLYDFGLSLMLVGGYLTAGTIFYVLIRSGWNERVTADPSLTLPQTACGMVAAAIGYAILTPIRALAVTLMVIILVFAMFSLRPAQTRVLALFAFAMLCVAIGVTRVTEPASHPPLIELTHALFTAISLGAVAVLAGRMGVMRGRLKSQKVDLQQALERIGHLATRDELTGLVNRRHMGALLTAEQERQRRGAEPMTVALLDIDLFKRINDTHGHPAGDKVLQRFAAAGSTALRTGDVLARWGGEEFLLMLRGTTPKQAEPIIERVRHQLAAVSFDSIAPQLRVTFSSGLSACGPDDSLDACIERADQAMYRAKTQGRNCTVLA